MWTTSFSDYHRWARIEALHLRDHFKSTFPWFSAPSFAAGAASAILVPQAFFFCKRQFTDWRIRRLLSRRHYRAGMCVPSTKAAPVVLLKKAGFAIGYSEKLQSAVWASWFLCGQYQRRSRRRALRRTSKNTFLFSWFGIPSLARRGPAATAADDGRAVFQKKVSRMDFRPDPQVPAQSRVTLEEWSKKMKSLNERTNHRFDRGHLVPAATAASVGGWIDLSGGEATNEMIVDIAGLSNIVVQHASVNRGSWLRLEHLTRLWATRPLPKKSSFSFFSTSTTAPSVWSTTTPIAVCCGPIFAPSSSGGGGDGDFPKVPTAFWLAVLHCASGNCCAFVIENRAKQVPLSQCVISVKRLEQTYNLRIFRDLTFWQRPFWHQRTSVDLQFWRGVHPDGTSKKTKKKNKKQQQTLQSRLLDGTSNV